jgi:hypothetical protein
MNDEYSDCVEIPWIHVVGRGRRKVGSLIDEVRGSSLSRLYRI